jgi:SNF2 family DNA or RNA helicase
VVLDECHVIKEANTKQSKMACSFKAKRRWAVTGTIMQTKHDDIAMLFQFLRMKPFDTASGWKDCMYKHISRHGKGSVELSLLSKLMKHAVMRHMKTQVFEGEQILKLPDRTQSVRLLELSENEKKLYEELERRSKSAFAAIRDVQKETLKVISLLLPLRMLASSAANIDENKLTADESNGTDGVFTEKDLLVRLQSRGTVSKTQAEAVLATMKDAGNSCSVCLDAIEAPTTTACGHTFCNECISGVVHSTPGDTAPCPICRVSVQVSTLMQLVNRPLLGSTEDGENKALEKLLAATQGKRSTKVSALLASLHEMKRSEPGSKAVVFTQFAKTHKETVVALKTEGFGVVEIRGNMTQKVNSYASTASLNTTACFLPAWRVSERDWLVGSHVTAGAVQVTGGVHF